LTNIVPITTSNAIKVNVKKFRLHNSYDIAMTGLSRLFCLLHHQHFDGHIGGNHFQTEWIERTVHLVPIPIFQVGLTAIQIKIESGLCT
jgi:hypothetical protein